MRYTTVIDISEYPSLYRNHNVVMVYLHACLRSGYHDQDRDIWDTSIRRIAAETGLTVSAVRNALRVLQKAALINREGSVFVVKKFILADTVTARPTTKKREKEIRLAMERKKRDEQRDVAAEVERRGREALRAQGKTNYMIYYERMQARAAAGDETAKKFCEQNAAAYAKQIQYLKDQEQ